MGAKYLGVISESIADAGRLLSEPSVLAFLAIGCTASVASVLAAAKYVQFRKAPMIAAVISLVGAAASMFVAGGRALEFTGIKPALLKSCVGFGDSSGALDSQALLNIILFLPFAALLCLATRRPLVCGLIASGVAAGMELAQTMLDFGVCESSDFLCNFVGVWLGVGASAVLLKTFPWRRGDVKSN
jgi:hypothetical protein